MTYIGLSAYLHSISKASARNNDRICCMKLTNSSGKLSISCPLCGFRCLPHFWLTKKPGTTVILKGVKEFMGFGLTPPDSCNKPSKHHEFVVKHCEADKKPGSFNLKYLKYLRNGTVIREQERNRGSSWHLRRGT